MAMNFKICYAVAKKNFFMQPNNHLKMKHNW